MIYGNVFGFFNIIILLEIFVSKKLVNFLFLWWGCDNKIDFVVKKDWCGVCRGDDECVVCDGVFNLNVIISKYVLLIIIVLLDVGWF